MVGAAMGNDGVVEELLLEWEERRERGSAVEVEELCAGHPDVREEVERRIRALEAMYRVPNRVSGAESTGDWRGSQAGAEVRPGGALPGVIGGYEVVSLLGRGGMGVVYRAREKRLNREVALKMIVAGPYARPSERARFRNEAETIARLQHPNIVHIYAVGEQDGRPYFAMEWVEGGSLAQRFDDGRPWAADAAARLVETLARAIHYAHGRGIIHRDLKPANILLTPDGTPKISDFGLAKLREPEGDVGGGMSMTHTGAVLGTPGYMAPEQAAGDVRAIGPGADVYALGVVLYELLTGRTPFRGRTPLETLEQVRTSEPMPPRFVRAAVPRDLDTICLKCLEKDPARRYASAAELAEDLRRFVAGESISVRSSGVLDHLATALERSQYDREFREWYRVVLKMAPALATPHLLVFALAVWWPSQLHWVMFLPWVVLLVSIVLLFGLYWTRLHMPTSPAMRQFGSMLVAHWCAATITFVVSRRLFESDDVDGLLMPYPFIAVLAGQLFFNLGSSYWGRCYLAGLVFFGIAPFMTIDLRVAPLLFGMTAFGTFLAVGLHLRRLGGGGGREVETEWTGGTSV